MSDIYGNRDAMALDELGGYYIRHVCAMTKEHLHSKSEIAAELAHRDMLIDQLGNNIDELLAALELAESAYRLNVIDDGEPSSILDAMQRAIANAKGVAS